MLTTHRARDRAYSVRDEIERAPASDRLELALVALDEVFGARERVNDLRAGLGLTATEARLLAVLDRAAPRSVSKKAMHSAMYPADYDAPEIKIVDVLICKMRAKGLKIKTDWGFGYSIDAPIDVDAAAPAVRKPRVAPTIFGGWSPQDDADLLQMFERGDRLRVIADELGRTVNAVRSRLRRIVRATEAVGS
jgi:hypothetical protein